MSEITADSITIEQAKALINRSFEAGHHEMEAGYPYDNPLNDRARLMIHAFKNEHGAAWLGEINRETSAGVEIPILREWDGITTVLNFGAAFVLPAYDAEVERLIVEYRSGDFKAAYANIDKVFDRIYSIGGAALNWN